MQCLAEALTVNKVLEELTLGQNKIGSNGIKHIAAAFASGQAVLTTLEIGKNGIDQEGALALAKALCNGNPNCLQNLYIDNNPMGDVGAGAFGALLAKNAVLRVLDLSYSQMSLLGLRDLSMGLAYSSSLLCLLLDGHDWASTQYMRKTNGLTGMSLSAKGASNYAASCIVGAINSNPKSLLLKLTGVDLSSVVSPPSSGGEYLLPEDTSAEGGNRDRETGAGVTRRYSDTLTRNERILKYLQENRRPPSEGSSSNKRKNVDQVNASVHTSSGSSSDTSEQVHPKYQRLDANGPVKSSSSSGSIGSNSDAMATATAAGATANITASAPSYSARRPPRVGLPSRGSIVQFPTTPAQNRLSLKSPRYESTMEIQVRKVILDIASFPFNADEYATLQTYYLGGCMSPKEDDVEETKGSVDADDDAVLLGGKRPRKNSLSCADADLCPACRTSRLAKFRRVMLLKARLESKKEATEEKLLVILRQLHYLIGVFQHVDNADDKIDSILVSVHDPSLLASPPRPRQQTASGLPPTAPYL
ncbi:Protein nlrc3, partial [Globisporangium splendens]